MSFFDAGRIWQPSVKDAASQLAPSQFSSFQSFQIIDAVANLNTAPVETDKVLMLSHVYARNNCGAGEVTQQIRIIVADSSAPLVPLYVLFDTGDILDGPSTYQVVAGTRPNDLAIQFDCSVIVMPNQVVNATYVKNAGGVNALRELSATGLLIPRGNFQR